MKKRSMYGPANGYAAYSRATPGAYHKRLQIRKRALTRRAALAGAGVVALTAAGIAVTKSGILTPMVSGVADSMPGIPDVSDVIEPPDPRDKEFAVDPSRTDWNYESNGKKTLYLTFDDGPSANTEDILSILDTYGAKATFFVTNQFPDYLLLIAEEYERGHTVGLHSYSHDYSIYTSEETYFEDLDKIGQVVSEYIGYVPLFIRFPGGSSNTISANYCSGIMTTLAQAVQDRGYQYWDWNSDCGDGATVTTEEAIAESQQFSEENLVFLAHDASAKTSTVEALPSIIEYFQGQGYTLEALTRESLVDHHNVNN